MDNNTHDIRIPTVHAIKHLLDPIFNKLDHIESQLSQSVPDTGSAKHYRNNDLKRLFGLANNTIIKYRQTGLLPYTKLGEVYLYEVKLIDAILKENAVKF